jgi:hypothetical protein
MQLNDTGRESDVTLTTPTNPPTNRDVGGRGRRVRADLAHHESTARRHPIRIFVNEFGRARCLAYS